MGYLLATTGNHAYNSLVCSVFIQHFGRNRVFQIATNEKKTEKKQLSGLFRGKVLFGGNLVYKELILQYIDGWRFQRTKLTEEFDFETLKTTHKGRLKPFIRIKNNGELDLDFFENQSEAVAGDTIISFSLKENGKQFSN